MQVLITGGTGFVGRQLCRRLLDQGYGVTCIGTRSDVDADPTGSAYIQADTTQPGSWQHAVAGADIIFNLAGRTIFHRWTRHYTRKIIDSRILTTRNIIAALPEPCPSVLVSTSAVGYYGGDGRDRQLTETSPNGNDFLARLSRDWEAEAVKAADKGTRVALARFGVVLGVGGGALHSMLPAFRSFMGGPMGSGRQWVSWIHMDDLINALMMMGTQPHWHGPVNLCAPHPVRNVDLAKSLGRALGRPACVPMPAVALKLILGEMASVLLGGQRVSPQKLLDAGFEFQYPELDDALADILG